MKTAVLLAPNTYVQVFDFAEVFNLATGKIIISLSPSVINDPSGIASIRGEITHPYKKILPDQVIFTPADLKNPYSTPLPKIGSTPVWGVYTTTLTLVMKDNIEYKVSKSFNLCPPVFEDVFESGLKSDLYITVDCASGYLFVNDFVCRLYKGKLPASMVYNLTHFFPKESGIAPAKNIQIPYTSVAYNGLNRVAGYNDSTFEFDDHISVVIRVTGEEQKDVRCVPDYTSIYCGMRKLYDDLMECMATPDKMAASFNEAEMLVWSITVGAQKGKDISDDIIRLEEILGVSCTCHGCPGERVGPAPGCISISNPEAINLSKHIYIRFNADGVPAGSVLKVSYRPYCNTDAVFTDLLPEPVITGTAIQSIDFPVKYSGVYQLRLTTIVDGRACGTIDISTADIGECPQIVDINAAVA